MNNQYFLNKPRFLLILVMIAIASIAVRALIHYDFDKTALLYVGIPFSIAMVLVLVRSPQENVSWKRQYLNRLIDAFIIMLGSSVVLFEGFLCVAMFIPIYLSVILLVFLYDYLTRRARRRTSTLSVQILPLLIFVSATEGVIPDMNFSRNEQVSISRDIPLSLSEIRHNLIQDIDLHKSRPWLLHLFPMPYAINAGSLNPGDVHEVTFRYYRWFFTNVHQGHLLIELSEVRTDYIRTTFIEDSSYLSHYLRLQGSEILMQPLGDKTRVTLRISYRRSLDPYWYFSPVTRYGVTQMAELLMKEVIARESF